MEKKELTIIKVGTGVIANRQRTAIDYTAMASIGRDIARIEGRERKDEKVSTLDHEGSVILVSSGAVAAGKEKLGMNGSDVCNTRQKQMAAMVGNTALFGLWEAATGIVVGHDLPTHNDLELQEHWDNMVGVIATNLEYGVLSGFNEGDVRSTEELETNVRAAGRQFKRFGDNDQLAAIIGVQIGAFAKSFVGQSTRVIFLTNTNGVLEDVRRPDSRIDELRYKDIDEIIEQCLHDETADISNGGMLSKLLAAKQLVGAGVSVSIGAGKNASGRPLLDLYNRVEHVGTHILA